MRRCMKASLILLAIGLMAQPLNAQVDLTDNRTAEQKWSRSVFLIDFAYIGFISYAKSVGQTPEQLAEFMIDFGARTWGEPGSGTLAGFVRGMFRNYNLNPRLEFEILSESESEIRGRMNAPNAARFGETAAHGVTLQEFQQLMTLFYEGVADYLGLDMTHEVSGEWVNFTVKTR